MTLLDIIVLALLLFFGLSGYSRGAIHEVLGLIGLACAFFVASHSLAFTEPLIKVFMNRQAAQPSWAITTGAFIMSFIISLIAIKLFGDYLVHQMTGTYFGVTNKIFGAGIGVLKGLAILGLLVLLIQLFFPKGAMPSWVSQSKFYPLARKSAEILRLAAPKALFVPLQGGLHILPQADLNLGNSVTLSSEAGILRLHKGLPSSEPDPSSKALDGGYSEDARKAVDRLLEQVK